MNCSKCGIELKRGDYVLEIGYGVMEDSDTTHIDEAEAVLCTACEMEIMPAAFWAGINED